MTDNWLKQYRFTAMQLPRRDLRPGDVLFRSNGSFDQKVGDLSMLFSSSDAAPETTSGEPAGSIARSIEKKVEAHLGARILGSLLGAVSSSKLGADLDAKRASSLAVTYEGVTQDSVAVLGLQRWLQKATIDTAGQAQEWLNDGKLAVVTAVLRTARLSVVAERENGVSISFSVPEIQGLVGGDAKVSSDSSSSSKITFTGGDPIAFGFQAFTMIFDDNVWLGLEEARAAADEISAAAWTSDSELEAVVDAALPA